MEVGISIERALEISLFNPIKFTVENISINEAHGRILAQSLVSKVDDPRFDNSAMDGWAVIESDCIHPETKLFISSSSQAGTTSSISIVSGNACQIMTGAPIPDGANAIVMVEDSKIDGNHVIINGPARPNYIRKKGENIVAGEIGLESGVLLGPSQLALAAMMGYSEIPVIVPPKIAIIGTGDELVEPGNKLEPGQIFESNTTALVGLVTNMGCQPVKYPFVNDDIDMLREIFEIASVECDAIITSGGVSMGKWDLVRRLMEEEGDVKFWKVLVKPGGPPLFGTWNKIPFFGLPGNPVSSQVIFLSIVSPWISSSCNYHENQGPNIYQKVRVKLLNSAVGTKHKITMRRINIYFQDDILVAEVPTNQGSGNLRSLVDCNGLTLLQPGTNGNVGDVVDALWLK
tara:strand:+ start:158 stop:1366 length:1209 start_codon:yes stop_codon:yes gene_type:complete